MAFTSDHIQRLLMYLRDISQAAEAWKTKNSLSHWETRKRMAFALFKQEVDKAELLPPPDGILDDTRVSYYARRSFELVDIFLMEERQKKEGKTS